MTAQSQITIGAGRQTTVGGQSTEDGGRSQTTEDGQQTTRAGGQGSGTSQTTDDGGQTTASTAPNTGQSTPNTSASQSPAPSSQAPIPNTQLPKSSFVDVSYQQIVNLLSGSVLMEPEELQEFQTEYQNLHDAIFSVAFDQEYKFLQGEIAELQKLMQNELKDDPTAPQLLQQYQKRLAELDTIRPKTNDQGQAARVQSTEDGARNQTTDDGPQTTAPYTGHSTPNTNVSQPPVPRPESPTSS